MTVPRVNSVMIDCVDREAMAAFWTGLLEVGVRHASDAFTWLEPQREGAWSLAFQQVAEPTPGKNKLHLDAFHPDLGAMAARVESLGGRVVERYEVDGFAWWVFADVEDNVFCAGHPL